MGSILNVLKTPNLDVFGLHFFVLCSPSTAYEIFSGSDSLCSNCEHDTRDWAIGHRLSSHLLNHLADIPVLDDHHQQGGHAEEGYAEELQSEEGWSQEREDTRSLTKFLVISILAR